jgi:toxin FitB
MRILDTNVVSELLRPKPDARVLAWVSTQPPNEFFITTITEAELRYGVAALPSGKRKTTLIKVVDAVLQEDFEHRILPFDSSAAIVYAAIVAHRRKLGRPIPQFDAQIAAIARAHKAETLVTHNAEDFLETGLNVVNPWVSASAL